MSTSIADLAVNISTNIASLNDGMKQASEAVSSAAERMAASFGAVNGAIDSVAGSLAKLAGLAGIGFGVGAFIGMISGAIEGQAELLKLSERTGATVEALSAMKTAATYAGVGMDQVAQSLARFDTAITQAQTGTGKQAAALTALGFDAKTFVTQFSTTDQALLAVVQRLNEYGTGIGKVAIEQALLGRSGAGLAVFYKELAERGLDNVTVTTAQAKAAKALDDSIIKLQSTFKGMIRDVATQLVPVLQAVVDGFSTFKDIAIAAFAAFVVWPAVVGTVTAAFVAYREAVIGAALANELLGASTSVVGTFFANILKLPAAFTSGWAAALTGVGALIFAAFAGWKFGDWLQENFFEAKVAGAYFVDWMLTAWENVKYAAQVAWAAVELAFSLAVEKMRVEFGAFIESLGQGLAYVPGMSDMAAQVTAFGVALERTAGTAIGDFNAKLKQLGDSNAAAKASIHAITDDMKIYAVQVGLLGKAAEDSSKGPAPIPDPTKVAKAVADSTKSFDAYVKAMAAMDKAGVDAQAKLATQGFTNSQAELKRLYEQGVLDFQQYWDAKTAVEMGALDIQEKQLQADVDIQQKVVDQLAYNLDHLDLTPYKTQAAAVKAVEDASAALFTATAKLTTAQAAHDDAVLKGTEIGKGYYAALVTANAAILANTQALNTQVRDQLLANQAIGLTKSQYEALLVAKDQDYLADMRANGASQETLDNLARMIAARQKLVAAIASGEDAQRLNTAWTDTFKSLAAEGATFIENFVTHGTSAFKTLWSDFKAWALKAFAEIAAQKVIISIAGSIGLAGTATNALAGSSPLGSILGGGSSGGGLGGLGSLFGTGEGSLFTNFTSGLQGVGSSFSNLFSALGNGTGIIDSATSAFSGIGATIGQLIPGLGLIGAAVGLLSGLLGHGGAPKTGGSAAGGIDLASGAAPDVSGVARYFTPNQADSTVKQIVDSVTATYAQVAKVIGLTTGQAIFNLGFDTDPHGTAGSRVSGGAIVGGQSVFNQRDVSVGSNDAATIQTDLALEAQRALLAALQASNLPTYLASVFKSVDAATATSTQITNIIATAEALKQAVTIVSGLGDQFSALQPEQIQGLISAFGSLQNFTAGFAYLGANFTTTAQKMSTAQTQLNTAFASLGLAVPKTHQAFLDLLSSLDLTTTDGQQTYASLVSLAPLFVQVAGTADQAAAALNAQAAATQKVIDSATTFFQANFYSAAEQSAQKLADDAAAVAAASSALGISIPTTVVGFRDLVTATLAASGSTSALYQALIVLAPAVFGIATAASAAATASTNAATAITSVATAITDRSGTIGDPQSIQNNVTAFLQSIATIAGNIPNATFGEQLGTQITLIGNKIRDLQTINPNIGYDAYQAVRAQIANLQGQSAKFADELSRYTILTAQYGSSMAKQLVALQDSYAQQAAALSATVGGLTDTANTAALAALKTTFDAQWAAIIAGTGGGVTGTIDQLKKLRDGIATYLQGLQVGANSPLTPMAQLAAAQSNFETEIAKALGGDQSAIADVTKYADTYLNLARTAYASSKQYGDIFNAVTGQLGAVAGTTPKGQLLDSSAQLLLALPTNGGTIASSGDLLALEKSLVATLVETQAAVANSNSADTATLTSELNQVKIALVAAIANGLK